jgi:hypothetical protein
MNEGRSEDFRKHFATHFFNPRYLKLFCSTWTTDCDPEVTGLLNALREKF